MSILFTILLMFILLSRVVENFSKIPTTLSLIVFSFILSFIYPDILNITADNFDDILYLMLPVILLPDILNISASQLKKHYKEIFYLAVIAVVISISVAVLVTPFLMTKYEFSVGMLITLFTMLMATDAITVSSIMSKFKLPHKLKIYAESESLFNDVTALIIFYFIALPMISGGDFTIMDINNTLIKVLFLSTIIGMVIAYIGYFTIKVLKNSFDQFIVIYLIVIISFMIAEHFHIAGILSIVTSVLTFKYLVNKELTNKKRIEIDTKDEDLESSLMTLIHKVPALTKKDFREYKKESEFIGIFANAIVFMILANMIDINSLLAYTEEILIVFLLTTTIRFGVINGLMFKFDLPKRWARALTYAGTKGALAIIMVHSIPTNFIYRDMFEAIVVGNVLLTTFIYTILLMRHISKYEGEYKIDMQNLHENTNQQSMASLVDLMKKDINTGAYTQSFIEDILEKELSRTKRYKIDFSCILIEINANDNDAYKFLGEIINNKIRENDYFGQFDDNRLIILTASTSLSGAMVLSEKIEHNFKEFNDGKLSSNFFIGITQVGDVDTYSSIMEKLDEALNKAKDTQTPTQIEIEI